MAGFRSGAVDNPLPDSPAIRKRVAERFRTGSVEAFGQTDSERRATRTTTSAFRWPARKKGTPSCAGTGAG